MVGRGGIRKDNKRDVWCAVCNVQPGDKVQGCRCLGFCYHLTCVSCHKNKEQRQNMREQ